MKVGAELSRNWDFSSKVARLFYRGANSQRQRFNERGRNARNYCIADLLAKPASDTRLTRFVPSVVAAPPANACRGKSGKSVW